jgi:hypothetical protein
MVSARKRGPPVSQKAKTPALNRRHSKDQIWSFGVSAATEHATVDFALAVFQVDEIASAVQVVHFALCNGRDAEGAGEFADRSKHRFILG